MSQRTTEDARSTGQHQPPSAMLASDKPLLPLQTSISSTTECSLPNAQLFRPLNQARPVPAALESVRAGFPSVAQDYFAGDFSFDENVILHPDTTFILTVAGDSMEGAGIFDGDLLVVDRSLSPEEGDVVVAILDNELTVKRLLLHGHTPILHPENPRYPDFAPQDNQSLEIWGVVTGNFHSQKRITLVHHHITQQQTSRTSANMEADPAHSPNNAATSATTPTSTSSAYLSAGWE
ncbi:MAG: S24 family peptidase [Bifidobacterium sp.]|nr:S24 family peptidase [Bifidobacterium sp.]MCH4174471.1 S24 family peptidase [Bifidobacterium sp.]